ncbi:hypothetical protein [Vibrio superstes]|uniref:hypothetical protein n=1 Tax=Vibrio superstes TaxID=198815 RepID=UPI0013C2B577|nr:hypothetical protein [Vibrio superstes]
MSFTSVFHPLIWDIALMFFFVCASGFAIDTLTRPREHGDLDIKDSTTGRNKDNQ